MDKISMKHLHLLSTLLFMFGVWGGMKVHAMLCYIGNEPDANGTMKWMLPCRDACECTEIRLGGINAQPPPRPFAPKYPTFTLEIKNRMPLMDLLNCTKMEPECKTFEGSGYQYHYKFAPLPKSPDGQVFVNFSVRANNSVHISLVGQNKDAPDMYEIVIGAWYDTACVIRRQKQAQPQERVNKSSGWLDGQTFKHFWVSAIPGTSQDGTETMTISVGRGSDENPFMEYIDPSPLPVNYLGFSMWDNVYGSYKFCGLHLKY